MQPLETGADWIKNTIQTVLQFLRRPAEGIKSLPRWSWGHLALVQVVIAAGSGALGGLLDEKIVLSIFLGLFLSPILTVISILISSIYFYYMFQIFAEKDFPKRQIVTIVLFASIPQTLLQIISGYLPIVALVGMAFTALLLIIGFVENLRLPRSLVVRLVLALYFAFIILWGIGQVVSKRTMDSNFSSRTESTGSAIRAGKLFDQFKICLNHGR